MRLGLTIAACSLIALLTGCSTGERPLAVDPSTDPAWQPPGQGELSVSDPAPEKEAKPKPKPRARQLQQPNRRDNDTLRLRASR